MRTNDEDRDLILAADKPFDAMQNTFDLGNNSLLHQEATRSAPQRDGRVSRRRGGGSAAGSLAVSTATPRGPAARPAHIAASHALEEAVTNAVATEARDGELRREIHDVLGEVLDNYPERLGLIVGWVSEHSREPIGRDFLSFARRAVER